MACEREVCRSLEGCYMILFDNPWQTKQCCEVCKRCQYQGKTFDSGQTWVEADDPCVTLHCRVRFRIFKPLVFFLSKQDVKLFDLLWGLISPPADASTK